MAYIVALRGEEREMVVEGRKTRAVPFLGADRGGSMSKLGIGLQLPVEMQTRFWGRVSPHMPVRMWRAFLVLEQLSVADVSTLHACWHVADCHLKTEAYEALLTLAPQFGGRERIRVFRESLIEFCPVPQVLDSILDEFRVHDVYVDPWELEYELVHEHVLCTHAVDRALAGNDKEKTAARMQHLFAPQPMPEPVSPFSRLLAWFRS